MNELYTDRELQHQIDLLIDDLLSAEEVTMLLQQLELNPLGYRQCVLTLVESREVKKALLTLKETPSDSVDAVQAGENQERFRQWLSRGLSQVMLASALILAFFVGRSFSGALSKSLDIRVAGSSSSEEQAGQTTTSEVGSVTVGQGPAVVTQRATKAKEDRVHSNQPETLSIVGYAQVSSGPGAPRRFPVVAGEVEPEQLEQWGQLPERIQRQARNQGFAIQTTRRIMMLQLADGTAYSVPLESIAIQHVGERML